MPRADDELKRTHDESIAAGQRTEENSGQDGKLQIPSSSKGQGSMQDSTKDFREGVCSIGQKVLKGGELNYKL